MKYTVFLIRHKNHLWYLNDTKKEIYDEVLIKSTSEIIDNYVQYRSFLIMEFSNKEFEGYDFIANWVKKEKGGNWYKVNNNLGWLCSVLYEYFKKAPAKLYVKII